MYYYNYKLNIKYQNKFGMGPGAGPDHSIAPFAKTATCNQIFHHAGG